MGAKRQSMYMVELRPGGADDPDARRAASVLGAYFDADQARGFRRSLWRGIAFALAIGGPLQAATSIIPGPAFVIGLVVLATTGVAGALAEWRAEQKLRDLLTALRN